MAELLRFVAGASESRGSGPGRTGSEELGHALAAHPARYGGRVEERRPRLDPAVAAVRLAVRRALAGLEAGSTVLVALSGGADSLALAAAAAFEAPKLGLRAMSATIDHGLQAGSTDAATAAVAKAEALGLEARVVRVEVGAPGRGEPGVGRRPAGRGEPGAARRPDASGEPGAGRGPAARGEPLAAPRPDASGGPEAAAREARYRALAEQARTHGAAAILTGHTLDDQAETVLLGLARGAGAASLQGMAEASVVHGIALLRPLLTVHRTQTRAACAAENLQPWDDPHNADPRFARVRVRATVLPVLETELGPGVAEALARTAAQLREDAEAFDEMVDETIEDLVEHAEAGISVSATALAANPAALRHRIIRRVVAGEFHESLTRTQTLEVARLVTDWSGQGPIDLPGCRARRVGGRLEFTAR